MAEIVNKELVKIVDLIKLNIGDIDTLNILMCQLVSKKINDDTKIKILKILLRLNVEFEYDNYAILRICFLNNDFEFLKKLLAEFTYLKKHYYNAIKKFIDLKTQKTPENFCL